MKIVCDACQAKYSISDDKVQGKVFKIRCKKCSNIIVVRGAAGASAEMPAAAPEQAKETRVYDYGYEGGEQQPAGDEAVWHVVINQDQVGPMTVAEVQQRFNAGEIDAETYVWREGFADWLPLAQVDVFAGFAASGQQTAMAGGAGPAAGGGGAEAIGAMFGNGGEEAGTVRSDPGDLFAAASGGARHSDDDGDLFGSKPASSRSPAAASATQSAGGNSKLRGERNENSVLFSLGNLAQLASDKPAPVTSAPSSQTMPGHASGAAGGEGSGLIDIRSMANAYMGGQGAAAKPATASAIGSIDDLPVFGGGGFSEPAVIVPTARASGNNKLLYALIGSVGLLAVAAVILVVVMVKGGGDKDKKDDKKDDTVAAKTDKPAGDDDKDKKADPKPEDPKPVAKDPDTTDPSKTDPSKTDPAKDPTKVAAADPTKKDPAKDPAKTTPEVKKDEPKKDPVKKDEPKKDPTKVAAADPKKDPTKKDPAKDPAKTDPKAGGGDCDEVTCVMNSFEGACCQRFKKGGSKTPAKDPAKDPTATTTKPAGDLPASLTRDMISAGVGRVAGSVQACGRKSSAKGTVKVSVKVGPGGNVLGVSVKEQPDAALGQCVANVMSGASFAKTQQGGSFSFPFVF